VTVLSRHRGAAITLVVLTSLISGCGGSSRTAPPAPKASAQANVNLGPGSIGSLAAPNRRAGAKVARPASGPRRSAGHAVFTDRHVSTLVRRSAAGAGIPVALHALAAQALPKPAAARKGHHSSGTLTFARTGGKPSVFLTSADAICRSYRTTVRGIAAQATTLALQEAELQNLVQASGAALRQLQALAPPKLGTTLAERFITLTSRSITDFVYAQTRSTSTSEAVGTANETQDMDFAQRSASDALDADTAARKLGLKICGSPGAEWF